TMGPELERRKEAGAAFYSGWKTFGVGMASMAVTLGLVGPVFFLAPKNSTDAAYQKGWDRIVANETRAQGLSTLASQEGTTEQEMLNFIDQTYQPAW
ncbi:hypothetical protein OVO14_10945, partial [Streptococcus pneumoniae]|nr:hypothetical protein [Streptococcus pneumoniae]